MLSSEAAKFLPKLIQESKDEPTKLATKLYVILEHMRSIGKDNSVRYQIISREMETVINQHGLDIEALMSSRPPLAIGTQVGDSSASQVAGSLQRATVEKDPKESFAADGSVSHLNGASNNIHGGKLGASASCALIEQGIPVQTQGDMSNKVLETTVLGIDGSRDSGKLPVLAPIATSTPFKERHLKQLRALVFLALRNGYMPKRLHLDIALGNFSPKEVDGSSKDLMDQKGKQPFDDACNKQHS